MKDKISKYQLISAELDDNWQQFISQSPQYSAYAEAIYIKALADQYQTFYCIKGNEKMAAVLILVSADGNNIVHHGLMVHDGIFYRDLSHLNLAQQHSEQFAIQTFIAETLAEKFNNITLTLHPSIQDIRPLLWVNYHNDDAMFSPDIRYTSLVDISDFTEDKPLEQLALYQQASVARRQEIRYGYKKQVRVEPSKNLEQLKQLYLKTMSRQEIELEQPILERMLDLVSALLNAHKAQLFAAYTTDGELGSMAVFLCEPNCAHFLIGANEPNLRNAHTGTAVLWQAFYSLAKQGITQVNLEGINSPQRGWFKLSFGGSITPYYQVSLVRR